MNVRLLLNFTVELYIIFLKGADGLRNGGVFLILDFIDFLYFFVSGKGMGGAVAVRRSLSE